jgi:hypothetical protein
MRQDAALEEGVELVPDDPGQLCAVPLASRHLVACHRVHVEVEWTRSFRDNHSASRWVSRTLTVLASIRAMKLPMRCYAKRYSVVS